VETFKLSNNPQFGNKLIDVVGPVLEPAEEGGGDSGTLAANRLTYSLGWEFCAWIPSS
jgi:hypothetical protein